MSVCLVDRLFDEFVETNVITITTKMFVKDMFQLKGTTIQGVKTCYCQTCRQGFPISNIIFKSLFKFLQCDFLKKIQDG